MSSSEPTLLPDWYFDARAKGLPHTLGIEMIELTESRVVATMPVDERTRQPFGLLHGGASIALAETVASFGAAARIDRERFMAVGQEINGNHLRPKFDGVVRATAVAGARGSEQSGLVDRDRRRARSARLHLALHDGHRRAAVTRRQLWRRRSGTNGSVPSRCGRRTTATARAA